MLVLNRADLIGTQADWAEIIDVLEDAFLQKSRVWCGTPLKAQVTPGCRLP